MALSPRGSGSGAKSPFSSQGTASQWVASGILERQFTFFFFSFKVLFYLLEREGDSKREHKQKAGEHKQKAGGRRSGLLLSRRM